MVGVLIVTVYLVSAVITYRLMFDHLTRRDPFSARPRRQREAFRLASYGPWGLVAVLVLTHGGRS